MSDNNEAKWYVIHTYSGYENKVANDLEKMVENRGMQDRIFQINIPTEKVTEIKDDKAREVERKIFPGYVLIKMIVTDESWYVVRNIHGVTGFVGPASKPVPLSDEEAISLGVEKADNDRKSDKEIDTVKRVVLPYKEGDRIRVTYGPFEGEEGVVKEIDIPNSSVYVYISTLGRDTPVEMDFDWISLAD